jgi:ligand-binding SRPBCC domain-containing protein
MKFAIETRVEADYLTVKEKFDENLFKALSPSFPKVRVVLFEGSRKGDKVSLEMDLLLFKQKWVSIIVDDATDDKEFFFIDEGEELPFFLGSWRHKHRIIKNASGSIIRDEIQYSGRFFWMTPLLYPVLYAQFANRRPIYKKYFRKKISLG